MVFVKMNNAARSASRSGRAIRPALDDPALKAFKEDLADKLDEASKVLKEKLGVTSRSCSSCPRAPSARGRGEADPKAPVPS